MAEKTSGDMKVFEKIGDSTLKLEYDILKKINQEEEREKSEFHLFPKVMNYREEDTRGILTMEYIDGITLQNIPRAKKVQWMMWMEEVARGMVLLHKLRPAVIWCDCKPENLMIDREYRIHLIDFDGSCYQLKQSPNRIYGTRAYAAPEQKTGGILDERTDIYGFGATFLKLLPAWKYVTIRKLLRKCVEPQKEKRFQTASELLYELKQIRR